MMISFEEMSAKPTSDGIKKAVIKPGSLDEKLLKHYEKFDLRNLQVQGSKGNILDAREEEEKTDSNDESDLPAGVGELKYNYVVNGHNKSVVAFVKDKDDEEEARDLSEKDEEERVIAQLPS